MDNTKALVLVAVVAIAAMALVSNGGMTGMASPVPLPQPLPVPQEANTSGDALVELGFSAAQVHVDAVNAIDAQIYVADFNMKMLGSPEMADRFQLDHIQANSGGVGDVLADSSKLEKKMGKVTDKYAKLAVDVLELADETKQAKAVKKLQKIAEKAEKLEAKQALEAKDFMQQMQAASAPYTGMAAIADPMNADAIVMHVQLGAIQTIANAMEALQAGDAAWLAKHAELADAVDLGRSAAEGMAIANPLLKEQGEGLIVSVTAEAKGKYPIYLGNNVWEGVNEPSADNPMMIEVDRLLIERQQRVEAYNVIFADRSAQITEYALGRSDLQLKDDALPPADPNKKDPWKLGKKDEPIVSAYQVPQ